MPGSPHLEAALASPAVWESAPDDTIINGMAAYRYDLIKAIEVRDRWEAKVTELKARTLEVERAYDARKTRRMSLYAAAAIRALKFYHERERQLELEVLQHVTVLPPTVGTPPRIQPLLEPTGLVRQCLERHGRTSAPTGFR